MDLINPFLGPFCPAPPPDPEALEKAAHCQKPRRGEEKRAGSPRPHAVARDGPLVALWWEEEEKEAPLHRAKQKSRRLRCEGHQDGASGNQRDLNDVDGRENYLLLLITHPRYHLKR